MFDYGGSTALVTGGSKGLGEAFAEALAARGMNVVLVARSTKKLTDLSARLYANYKLQCEELPPKCARLLKGTRPKWLNAKTLSAQRSNRAVHSAPRFRSNGYKSVILEEPDGYLL